MSTQPQSSRPAGPQATENSTGISNRESAEEEGAERAAFPPAQTDSPPPPQDAAGRVGDDGPLDDDGLQTAHKAGSRSIAQKAAESPYTDRPMPASSKVAGAFGKEPSASTDGDGPA